VTTDDWPHLYQQGRWPPGIFVSIELLVLRLGTGLYLQIPETRQRVPSLFFFSMGAGFLLLEPHSQLPGLVFRPDLASERHCYRSHSRGVTGRQYYRRTSSQTMAQALVPGRVGGRSAGHYTFPFHPLPGSPTFVGWVAAAVFTVPVFFAGLLFASEFRVTDFPSAALGTNMLGAVVGGLLENLSLVIGLKALYWRRWRSMFSLEWAWLRTESMHNGARSRCASRLQVAREPVAAASCNALLQSPRSDPPSRCR
jgi:hypothetical protein